MNKLNFHSYRKVKPSTNFEFTASYFRRLMRGVQKLKIIKSDSSVICNAIDEWRVHLCACLGANVGHYEQLLWCPFSHTSSDKRILKIGWDLTKLTPWVWWHPFWDTVLYNYWVVLVSKEGWEPEMREKLALLASVSCDVAHSIHSPHANDILSLDWTNFRSVGTLDMATHFTLLSPVWYYRTQQSFWAYHYYTLYTTF